MTIQRFETGPRMSQVVVHGDTVYLAGVVAGKAAGKSVTEQTQDILAIIDGHLAKAGTDKSKLLSATVYLANMASYDEMNAAWDAWVDVQNSPARATVEARLASPRYLVEIMAVAAAPPRYSAARVVRPGRRSASRPPSQLPSARPASTTPITDVHV